MTEVCNIGVILIGQAPLAIVFNFIALAIIADFDNYIFKALRNESMKKLLYEDVKDDILIKHHTTSKRAGVRELADVKDADGNLRLLKIQFRDRTYGNKILYLAYKCIRIWYVSCYFYFYPFLVIVGSVLLPLFFSHENE